MRDETQIHLERAKLMLERGERAVAHLYLATLHENALLAADLIRSGNDAHAKEHTAPRRDAEARHYWQTARDAGLSVDVLAAEARVLPIDFDVYGAADHPADHSCMRPGGWLASYYRAVPSTVWPDLNHLVHVAAEVRQKPGGFYVEAQIIAPDEQRTQHTLRRLVTGEEAALLLVGRWAALGDAVLRATT